METANPSRKPANRGDLRQTRTTRLAALAIATIALFMSYTPIYGQSREQSKTAADSKVASFDSTAYPATPPSGPTRFLFIHHSVGGQLLADPGPEKGENAIYSTHPNGGSLRALLSQSNYSVHEASYGSRIGQNTDIFDWPAKFQSQIKTILHTEHQDRALPPGTENEVIAFKSCFPNNGFIGTGLPPGNPSGPDLTLWNAKAAYSTLLPEFQKHPQTLFVCFTAPPLAAPKPQPGWKRTLKKMLRRDNSAADATEASQIAREFNDWLVSPDGWLKNYPSKNVVVFNYYHILTDYGQSNLAAYPSGNQDDSHPNAEGNRMAAKAFIPILNSALNRAKQP